MTTKLKYEGGMPTKVVKALFTWALDGGMWLEDSYGQRDWVSFGVIDKIYGQGSREEWFKTSYNNGMCGMWFAV